MIKNNEMQEALGITIEGGGKEKMVGENNRKGGNKGLNRGKGQQ